MTEELEKLVRTIEKKVKVVIAEQIKTLNFEDTNLSLNEDNTPEMIFKKTLEYVANIIEASE